MLTEARQSVTFAGWSTAPILSINRGFSAPVIVETNRSQADLAFLSAHDDDPFARYEAMQKLMVNVLVGRIGGQAVDEDAVVRSDEHTSELQSLLRLSYAVIRLKK